MKKALFVLLLILSMFFLLCSCFSDKSKTETANNLLSNAVQHESATEIQSTNPLITDDGSQSFTTQSQVVDSNNGVSTSAKEDISSIQEQNEPDHIVDSTTQNNTADQSALPSLTETTQATSLTSGNDINNGFENSETTFSEKTIEYYFPQISEPQNINNAYLYMTYNNMVEKEQFNGAFVKDFTTEYFTDDENELFKITLITDKGNFSAVFDGGSLIRTSID